MNVMAKAEMTAHSIGKGITLNSPNVLLNQMSPEERETYMATYKRGGPAGRPASA